MHRVIPPTPSTAEQPEGSPATWLLSPHGSPGSDARVCGCNQESRQRKQEPHTITAPTLTALKSSALLKLPEPPCHFQVFPASLQTSSGLRSPMPAPGLPSVLISASHHEGHRDSATRTVTRARVEGSNAIYFQSCFIRTRSGWRASVCFWPVHNPLRKVTPTLPSF